MPAVTPARAKLATHPQVDGKTKRDKNRANGRSYGSFQRRLQSAHSYSICPSEPYISGVAIMSINIYILQPHVSSPEWRTVLYFTLDFPGPLNVVNAMSVNELPLSYHLSTIPTLLRDSADTPLSKTYTVPATSTVPFPKLPITFPSLAMYLHAVLEESRRSTNDSSSGHRKLAKMVQTCYRADEPAPQRAQDRSSVGGLFKRVIRKKNPNKRAGGNEDTYELVTPFVPGEWG